MGGVETLIEQPALMSFSELTSAQRLASGIRDNLVRLSVGLEAEPGGPRLSRLCSDHVKSAVATGAG